MSGALTTTDVKTAAAEIARMRGALTRWLKFRAANDAVLAGTAKRLKKPLAYAQRTVSAKRDMALEQDLADRLHALLSSMFPDAQLPAADLSGNPNAAVQLAQIAVSGKVPGAAATAPAMSGLGTHPWLWPVLIVGGLLLVVTTAIKSAADLAAQKEQDACIEAGACTDYGFWLKAGGITVLTWFAWKELGVGEIVKKRLKVGK